MATLKDYFRNQVIDIPGATRRSLAVTAANFILTKRDRLSDITAEEVAEKGKRGKFMLRVYTPEGDAYEDFTGYFDIFSTNDQVLELVNSLLPQPILGRQVAIKVGLDGPRFSFGHWHGIRV